MKFYRVLDMTITKDNSFYGDNKYRAGSYGSCGGVMTSLDECASIIEKEKEKFIRGERFGEITILKDEIIEFQGKLVEDKNGSTRESLYSIKVVEIKFDI